MAPRTGHKFLFVIGGVMSGVGKGIATSSMGLILSERGFSVDLVKIDPYLNVDAGTMNPTEHGETFVLASGLETDQDMGNYERFLNRSLGCENYMTSGMVYQSVIARERALGYGGKCVEAVPHVRDEILERLVRAADSHESEVSIIEIGGTVGDFQNALFIEAARVLKMKYPQDVGFVLVSYLPVPGSLGEMKTKPTQNAVRELNSYGVQADLIIARSEGILDEKRKEKLAVWCNVRPECIIAAPDVESIYEVPLLFNEYGVGNILEDTLSLSHKKDTDLSAWRSFYNKVHSDTPTVSIGIVGKYFDTGDYMLSDAYLSVIEALKFSGAEVGVTPKVAWVNAKDIEEGNVETILSSFDGIIVPGGFGETGIEGKVRAIRYAREHLVPYFGLCYGMQLAMVEIARSVAGIAEAHTVEINPETTAPIIDVMPEQKALITEGKFGGTMRLGVFPCEVKEGTIAYGAYGATHIEERHRHRYEVHPDYIERLEQAGVVFSGKSPDGRLMEIAELPQEVHPFFLGTQFHPELVARPLAPHPLFTAFLNAVRTHKHR